MLIRNLAMPSNKPSKIQNRTEAESYNARSAAHRIWLGWKTITDYKGKPRRELPSDASLPDELNAFFMLVSRQATLKHA